MSAWVPPCHARNRAWAHRPARTVRCRPDPPGGHASLQAVQARPTRDGRARVYVVTPTPTAPDCAPP